MYWIAGMAIFGNWHGEKAADGEDKTELIRVE